MRFWDTSAVVPLLVEESPSRRLETEFGRDREMVVWWATSVECACAVARLERESILDASDGDAALEVLRHLERSWYAVEPSAGVRQTAIQALRAHDLRAADALQLAAALEWSGRPASGQLLTMDDRLGRAARAEGFEVPDLEGS